MWLFCKCWLRCCDCGFGCSCFRFSGFWIRDFGWLNLVLGGFGYYGCFEFVLDLLLASCF